MAPAMWSASDGIGFSKKHDAPGVAPHHAGPSRPLFGGFRRRRLLLIVVALVALYFFIKNIPTDVPPVGNRYNSNFGNMASGHVQAQYGLHQVMDDNAKAKTTTGKLYDGPIQFNNLASSLRPHLSYTGTNDVLFLLPDLTSTSILIPVACQMALSNHSTVHVALLGRQELKLSDIMKIHGVVAEDCPIFWHDVTPDRALESSDSRIETAIQSGFAHCAVALRPQVALTDDRFGARSMFGGKLQMIAAGAGVSFMTLPKDVSRSLPWFTLLDGASLLQLRNVEIEIVIQAYSESAGTLIRLLRSIESANYHGLHFPKITIELPAITDPFVLSYLERFQWPSGASPSESRLTLRHRLHTKRLSAAEASLRTIESFFPRVASTSHVLLLSPDAQLSPSYLHYLMFTILEYRYGQRHQELSSKLFGISLEYPEKKLSGQQPFLKGLQSQKSPFVLSQTPNSNALLVFGDKWSGLHEFLTERLLRDPELTQKSESAASVALENPHWLTEVSDLMQVEGQYVIYPAFAIQKNLRLVALHHELHQDPEEYVQANADIKLSTSSTPEDLAYSKTPADDNDKPQGNDNAEPLSASLPIEALLPHGDKSTQYTLPRLAGIPLYTFAGEASDWDHSEVAATKFAERFSLQQGGCASLESRDKAKQGSLGYFFCDTG